jgi:membrane peptidoglycan carboxypeptidase
VEWILYADFVLRIGPRAYGELRVKGKILALLAALSLVAGLLTATVALPIVGVVGLVAKDTATTFNNLPVADLGLLPARSELLDSSGHVIAYYYPRNIYRVPVSFSQIAPVMRNAIVAIEDERFWQHGALDLRGVLRAIITTLSGSGTQGGSDLAQQYVKNACTLTVPRKQQPACIAETVTRKLRELRAAVNVMRHMTRPQLLAAYLNAAYFDHQTWGIQVASRFYFSTSARDLSLDQAAMLAGLVQNPAAYDPLMYPKLALDRRNEVLAKMTQLGYISQAQQARAAAQPLGLHVSPVPLQTGCVSPQVAATAGFFCDFVLSVMQHDPVYAKAMAELKTSGGMKIYTTMDARDQRAANRAVNFVVPANSGYYNPGHNVDTEVLIQPGTGDVRAIAVDRQFGNGPGQTTIDYAVNTEYGSSAGVQTGSSSKIFTLVTALKLGLPFGYHLRVKSPTTVSPYFNCHGGFVPPYTVVNAEGPQGAATYTIYQGTVESINAFYATLEQRVGLCNVVKTAVSLGMTRADGTSLLRRDPHLPASNNLSADNYPSFTLGSEYVSPMSMADAYATLAARGIYCHPIPILAIVDGSGRHLPVESAHCHRVLSAGIADAANYVFRGVLGPSGTGWNRGIGIPAAAKTGTADHGHYAAFAGYTPRLCGYVSVFNPRYPTTIGSMLGYRADYREVNGLLDMAGQMFGDNAPGATWQMTFLSLHLRPESFVDPPYYPFFNLPLIYKPKPKPKPTPSGSPTPGPTTPTPTP